VTFGVYPLRLRFLGGKLFQVHERTVANLVRGQLGKILMREHPDAYHRYFAPAQTQGPSGFRDPPRPFVLRTTEPFTIGVNLFEMRDPPIALFKDVLTRVACETLGATALELTEGMERLDIPLQPGTANVTRVRVHFTTPTELKGASKPEFASLVSRIRDRVSLLRSLYDDGPLEIDFREMGERASSIAMTRCELSHESAERYSRTQGAAHPLGGFTGVAEYEGDLTEFLPLLEVARWTGVGRQTVWGKGEIHCEPI
jgi:hypothetical protein